MRMEATEGRWETLEIVLEGLCHIVIELIVAGWSVHNEEGALRGVCQGDLFREEAEVWNGVGVVIFDGVCVQADEMDVTRLKREVLLAKQLLINLVTIAENVMIPN